MPSPPNGARKANAKGRSTGRILHVGKARRWKLAPGFVPLPGELIQSHAFLRLSSTAYRILMFLIREHQEHGGAENGALLLPHKQVRDLGTSGKSIKPAINQLIALGFIRRTSETSDRVQQMLGGSDNASTFALTWLPTLDGELPTNDFARLDQIDVDRILGLSERRKLRKAQAAKRAAVAKGAV